MKVYFVDGPIKPILKHATVVVDACYGYSNCKCMLDLAFQANTPVITNCIEALAGHYTWNPILKKHELYFRIKTDFIPVQELTDRELTVGIDMIKLFKSGEFIGV